jgi:hypothetical protein
MLIATSAPTWIATMKSRTEMMFLRLSAAVRSICSRSFIGGLLHERGPLTADNKPSEQSRAGMTDEGLGVAAVGPQHLE